MQQLPLRPGFSAVSCSVGYAGQALRLLVRSALAPQVSPRIQSPGFASFPASHSAEKYDALLEVTDACGRTEIELKGLGEAFPLVQLFPDGKSLVVSSRCRRFKDGTHELNARTYDRSGCIESEFLLGDGIQHLQVDLLGNIWVGYSDEGIYGNYGWFGEGDSAPVGASGLICFSAKGERLWGFQPAPGADFIDDVYALNVFGNEAWAYYYHDLPLVRIKDDRTLETWKTNVSGARAFAVGDGKVLMFGSYDSRTAATSLDLTNTAARLGPKVILSITHGGELEKSTVIGRGNILHVLTDEVWYQFSASSLT